MWNLVRAATAAVSILLITGCSSFGAGGDPIEVIAFGSCARSDRDQPIWNSIVAQSPDLFLFIGDNIYADLDAPPNSGADIRAKYDELAAMPGWQRLNAACPVLATWDDHDYGLNDAGAEWHLKDEAQREFLEFFGAPSDSARWERAGVYDARTFGPSGRRVQIVLLDTRYHRSALTPAGDQRRDGFGPYVPNATGVGTMLGEDQWRWLEQQLSEPADLRIIASSIQVVADEHGWEAWGNMPHERERLFGLIRSTGAEGVVFVSGDRHLIELCVEERVGPYPMWDFTSSGFNWGEQPIEEPNRYRRGPVHRCPNFGVIRIDWDAPGGAELALVGHDGDGAELLRQKVALRDLRAR